MDWGKKRKKYQRTAAEYSHKLEVINYLEQGYDLDVTVKHFYGDMPSSDIRAKKKQLNKWNRQRNTIQEACESGRGSHMNLRQLGVATVLSREGEEELVLWLNSLRKDGAPVSRLMLKLQAQEVAADCGLDAEVAAKEFRTLVLQAIVERQCVQVYNAEQTDNVLVAVCFQYLPKQTISKRGVKTVWVTCANKEKARATAMLLGDWESHKHQPFFLFKTSLATKKDKRAENDELRHGFGVLLWNRVITALQEQTDCKLYGNKLEDTRVPEDEVDLVRMESSIIEELESCELADNPVNSDNGIGSGDDINSDNEDDV
ncbi:hypothetical protein ON010_g3953 [Phytophthora cinnamomi]|nr:hypothetical protein ON010_g3953 [Phytophthora cinnamomi]